MLDINDINPFICANCDCLDIMRDIPDKSVDMVLCDLPYGTTQNKWDSCIDLAQLWSHYNRICTGAVVLTAAQPFTSVLVLSNLKNFKYQYVWKKNEMSGHLNAKKRPLVAHEDVLVFGGKLYNPQMWDSGKAYRASHGKNTGTCYGTYHDTLSESKGMRYPQSVQEFKTPPNRHGKLHPTQKPVELMEYMIRTYTDEGMIVLDNCMGSGTTGVAAVKSKRRFIGIEKDKENGYFKVAIDRINAAVPLAEGWQ